MVTPVALLTSRLGRGARGGDHGGGPGFVILLVLIVVVVLVSSFGEHTGPYKAHGRLLDGKTEGEGPIRAKTLHSLHSAAWRSPTEGPVACPA